jgi:Domain of unknown function (DUF4253)
MLNTVESISKLLEGSFLADQELHQLEIDESSQIAFLINVESAKAVEAWQLMRSLLEHTKRYPIITYGWGSDDFFSRFYYKEEDFDVKIHNTSPESIISRVSMVDLETFLAMGKAASREYLEDSITYSLEETLTRFGLCPSESQVRELIDNGSICSIFDLEKWLFLWELKNFNYDDAIVPLDVRYLDWFDPGEQKLPLLLLPIENSWDSLAYLHWYGACSPGSPVAISFLKKWHQQYNAELVCHYGTMLQFNVGRRPISPEEAFELAWEQEALAECTTILPGISLRDHARSLLKVKQWFVHQRP